MSCNLTSGVSLDCRTNSGGIKTLYIASVTGTTGIVATATNGVVSSFTVDGTTLSASAALTTAPFYRFEVPKQTAFVTENGTFSEENGTTFFTQVVSFPVNKMEATKQVILSKLAKSERLCIVAEDNNGKRWLVGNDSGATLTTSSGGSGTAFGDRNGYVAEATGFSLDPIYEVVFAS
jgi:hypothetical protein